MTFRSFMDQGKEDDEIAWLVTDKLVKEAQAVFFPVWEETKANNGYVSFELDPLLEDVAKPMPHNEAVGRYVELGKKWAAGAQESDDQGSGDAGGVGCAGAVGSGGGDVECDADIFGAAI